MKRWAVEIMNGGDEGLEAMERWRWGGDESMGWGDD